MESSIESSVKLRGIVESKSVESLKSHRFLESRGIESSVESSIDSMESWNHAWN